MTDKTMGERIKAIQDAAMPPEYWAARQMIRDAQQLQLKTPPNVVTADPPNVAGRITEEWLEQMLDQQDANERYQRRRGILGSQLHEANSQATYASSNVGSTVLKRLHAELTTLLAAVKDVVNQLGGATTAAQAIEKDRVDAWKKLAVLADDYSELRASQMEYVSTEMEFSARSNEPNLDDHASDLHFENLDDIWPNWRDPDQVNGQRISFGRTDTDRPEPWPADSRELMVWLVTSQAKVWIPTRQDLARLNRSRSQRNNPTVIPGRPDKQPKIESRSN